MGLVARYTPRLADFMLNVLSELIPVDALESIFEHYYEGRCFITTDDALRVIDVVFPPCDPDDMYVEPRSPGKHVAHM